MTKSDEPGRDVRRDGQQIAVPVYIELRNWLNHHFATRAQQRKAQGIRESHGEAKGAGNAIARALCWLASLCDDDIERIQQEGQSWMEKLDALPPDYGKRLGKADPLIIRRRERSVFVPPESRGSPAGGSIGLSGGRPIGKNLGHTRGIPCGDEPDGNDARSRRNRVPGRR
jgi:hypothetical protein